MYAIEKELKILRQFISPKLMDDLKKWKCYSEEEILAAEKRLHVKLPVPIRDIYRHMAVLLVTRGTGIFSFPRRRQRGRDTKGQNFGRAVYVGGK